MPKAGSVTRLKGFRHLAKETLQGRLNHHFCERIELRVTPHLASGAISMGMDVDFQVEFDRRWCLCFQGQDGARRGGVVRGPSKWIATPPVTLKVHVSPSAEKSLTGPEPNNSPNEVQS